jgi:hypothetical protein
LVPFGDAKYLSLRHFDNEIVFNSSEMFFSKRPRFSIWHSFGSKLSYGVLSGAHNNAGLAAWINTLLERRPARVGRARATAEVTAPVANPAVKASIDAQVWLEYPES